MAPLLAALALVTPLALGGAVSPVMLSEQAVLLAGRDGMSAGTRYAAGVVVTALAAVLAVLLVGHSVELPRRPRLDASLDLVVGVVLLAVAGLVHALAGRRPERPTAGPHRPHAAFGFGVFSMATNFTTLALLIPAAKEIAAAHVGPAGRTALVLVVVASCTLPAWVPVALTRLAPDPGRRLLDAMGEEIARHGRAALLVLLAGAGLFFIARGAARLAG
jgi:hypothetical protein